MSLLTWTVRVAPEKKVKSDWRMSLSCRLRHWSRRLMSADNVIQMKYRARLLARSTTTSLVCTPNGRKRSFSSSTSLCTWARSSAESKARDWDTILSSHWTTSSTNHSANSASIPTTAKDNKQQINKYNICKTYIAVFSRQSDNLASTTLLTLHNDNQLRSINQPSICHLFKLNKKLSYC